MRSTNSLPPHVLATHTTLDVCASNAERGLSDAEAAERLARHGRNCLPERPGKPPWMRFLLQFHHPLIYIRLERAMKVM